MLVRARPLRHYFYQLVPFLVRVLQGMQSARFSVKDITTPNATSDLLLTFSRVQPSLGQKVEAS